MNFIPLPKYIITELRIVKRIIIEMLKGIRRTNLMNIVIISTMAAILSIFGCMFRASMGLSAFIADLGNMLEISVYLKPQANSQLIMKKIKNIDNVEVIKLIPKETAWKELKKQMDVPNIKNPLPDTLRVRVNKPSNVDKVVRKIRQFKALKICSILVNLQ